MFVYYYTFVPRPFDELAGIVDGHPYRWLPSSTPAGDRAEEGILVNLGTDRRLPLRKEVVILAGEPDRSPLRAILPLTVMAADAPGLFPCLKAELELAPFDDEHTQLTLRGSYRPPLGSVGGLLDQAL